MKNSIRAKLRVALSLVLVFGAGLALAEAPYTADLQIGQPAAAPESAHDCNDPNNPVGNCGFEADGATLPPLTDWIVTDAASPFINVQTVPAGASVGFGFWVTAPTEGAFEVLHAFDAAGPDTIQIGQDITLGPGGGATLEFGYRGAWDLATFGATADRTFEVTVEPPGGGVPMQTDLILTATAGDINLDTGPLSAIVDLSAFVGQTVHLNFVWTIPENFTGPGQFTVDNVLVTVDPSLPVIEIPALSPLGLTLLLTLLALASVLLLRRRRRRESG